MSLHFLREIEGLKKRLLELCAVVDEQVHLAVRSLLKRDEQLAAKVCDRDAVVDQREVEVEEECLKILALYQPVAVDLRFVVAVLKINNDLERIGDLAVNIARKARALATTSPVPMPFDLEAMSAKTQAMLRDSLDAMVNLDAKLAIEVCGRDDEIDGMKREARHRVEEMIDDNPANTKVLLKLLAVSRNLERIADLATNIAEDVVYMVDGQSIRHQAGG
jgi:phosphate transport system protein